MDDRLLLGLVEIASVFILLAFLALVSRGSLASRAEPGQSRSLRMLLVDILVIALAAWVAEVSCIRLYGFYQYDAPWFVFVDVMPLLVALIWPFVILSARELVHRFGGQSLLIVFGIVLYDASLVEPVAVRARLWSWNEPGIFDVPLIGILGWAYFSFFAVALLDRLEGPMRWALIVLAPLATHAALLISWWGALRWVLRAPVDPWLCAAAAWGISVALTAFVLRRQWSAPLEVMLPRMAAALLFFGLLALRAKDLWPLLVYGSAFALPYLAATRWRLDWNATSPIPSEG